MSYQQERDAFIARTTAEGLPLWAAQGLLRIATSIQRYAELACSSEAADRDRVPCPWSKLDTINRTAKQQDKYPCLCDGDHDPGTRAIPRITVLDWRAEQRAERIVTEANARIAREAGTDTTVRAWRILTAGDPRGYTLRVIPPSYAERNAGRDHHNLDSIGVPARDSRLKF